MASLIQVTRTKDIKIVVYFIQQSLELRISKLVSFIQQSLELRISK